VVKLSHLHLQRSGQGKLFLVLESPNLGSTLGSLRKGSIGLKTPLLKKQKRFNPYGNQGCNSYPIDDD